MEVLYDPEREEVSASDLEKIARFPLVNSRKHLVWELHMTFVGNKKVPLDAHSDWLQLWESKVWSCYDIWRVWRVKMRELEEWKCVSVGMDE